MQEFEKAEALDCTQTLHYKRYGNLKIGILGITENNFFNITYIFQNLTENAIHKYENHSCIIAINPKTAGGGVNLTPPVVFRKMYLPQRG